MPKWWDNWKASWANRSWGRKKKKTPKVEVSPTVQSSDVQEEKLDEVRQTSLDKGKEKVEELDVSDSSDDQKKKKWQMKLHVYGGRNTKTAGHAFLSLIPPDGGQEIVMGMVPEKFLQERTIGSSARHGQINGTISDDSSYLADPSAKDMLVSKTWEISEQQAMAAQMKFNRDRRLNTERLPKVSHLPHEVIKRLGAGGKIKLDDEFSKEDAKDVREAFGIPQDVSMRDIMDGKSKDFDYKWDQRMMSGGPNYNVSGFIGASCASWALGVIDHIQKPEVLKDMPGDPSEKPTTINTKEFRKGGIAIPHYMRDKLPERNADRDYRVRMGLEAPDKDKNVQMEM